MLRCSVEPFAAWCWLGILLTPPCACPLPCSLHLTHFDLVSPVVPAFKAPARVEGCTRMLFVCASVLLFQPLPCAPHTLFQPAAAFPVAQKANNCLLTRDMTAKIADVGFTRLLSKTHHSFHSGAAGSFDYVSVRGGWDACWGHAARQAAGMLHELHAQPAH